MKDAGYWNAIDNLAYEVEKLSKQSQERIVEQHPNATYEELMMLANDPSQYSDKENHDWNLLDKITFKVSEIYDVPIQVVSNDTWNVMIENLAKDLKSEF